MDLEEASPKLLVYSEEMADVTSEVLPIKSGIMEFFGAWLNAHILSWKLRGFISLYLIASIPEGADTWDMGHLFSAE